MTWLYRNFPEFQHFIHPIHTYLRWSESRSRAKMVAVLIRAIRTRLHINRLLSKTSLDFMSVAARNHTALLRFSSPAFTSFFLPSSGSSCNPKQRLVRRSIERTSFTSCIQSTMNWENGLSQSAQFDSELERIGRHILELTLRLRDFLAPNEPLESSPPSQVLPKYRILPL